VTLTVISNTAGGAWPIARYLENLEDGCPGR
jgi:hypothetical protein